MNHNRHGGAGNLEQGSIDWATSLPGRVMAGQTTRHAFGSVQSQPPFAQCNLALHVGDDASTVLQQRIALIKQLEPFGAKRLVWLNQTHGTQVHRVDERLEPLPVQADAMVCRHAGVACMIMTADCLPVILTDALGQEVACIHAGWRGLLAGIIEHTIAAMQQKPGYAWLGAAIGQNSFAVGAEVYEAFTRRDPNAAMAFRRHGAHGYLADIYQLARQRLHACGVGQVSGGQQDTVRQSERYYSYRQQAITGRMASFVMIAPDIPILNE